MTYIGIDNGTTGTIGIITPVNTFFFRTPVVSVQKPFKSGNTKVLDRQKLKDILTPLIAADTIKIAVETPVMGSFHSAVYSGARFTQAIEWFLEDLYLVRGKHWSYISAKTWQTQISGSQDTKFDSMLLGQKLFPEHSELIQKHGDADGLLIANYLKLKDGQKS